MRRRPLIARARSLEVPKGSVVGALAVLSALLLLALLLPR
jgi:hypothetical protein